MNYDEMKFIDTDIREALWRIYANTPPPTTMPSETTWPTPAPSPSPTPMPPPSASKAITSKTPTAGSTTSAARPNPGSEMTFNQKQ